MKLMPLTQGQFAKVDDADFDWLSQWKWTAKRRSNGNGFCAKRNIKKNGSQHVMYMSRQIMGSPEGLEIDHINRDTLDNQRGNLRAATHKNNLLNIGAKFTNCLGLKGVSAARKRWRAEIAVNGKRIRLGHFDSPELAHAAYLAAAKQYHGEFAFQGESA